MTNPRDIIEDDARWSPWTKNERGVPARYLLGTKAARDAGFMAPAPPTCGATGCNLTATHDVWSDGRPRLIEDPRDPRALYGPFCEPHAIRVAWVLLDDLPASQRMLSEALRQPVTGGLRASLNDEAIEKPAAVVVRFKSSSQPKGQDGYEIAVSSEATDDDIDRTMRLAARARGQAIDVLDGTYEARRESADAFHEDEVQREIVADATRRAREYAARVLPLQDEAGDVDFGPAHVNA